MGSEVYPDLGMTNVMEDGWFAPCLSAVLYSSYLTG
jgi:hypothetical protein